MTATSKRGIVDANYDDHRIWAWQRVSIGPLLWSSKTQLPVPPRALIGQPALISPIRPDLAPNRGRRSELFDVILPRPSRPPIAGIIFPWRQQERRVNALQFHRASNTLRNVIGPLQRPYLNICNCSSHICTQHLLLISTRPLLTETRTPT